MIRFVPVVIVAVLLPGGPAAAQVGPIGGPSGPSPLGITSPLGIGPAAPVGPVGIPMGATELANTGVSPTTSGVSPTGPTTGNVSFCAGFGSAVPQASLGSTTPIPGASSAASTFDGGGLIGNATGTCASGPDLARVNGSASSPTGMAPAGAVGRVGIPMGATELGAGGLSPSPTDPMINSPMASGTSPSTTGRTTN